MRKISLVVASLSGILLNCVQKPEGTSTDQHEAWNKPNDPFMFHQDYKDVLSELPLSGTVEVFPWTDHYWPSDSAGAAFRWNTDTSSPEKKSLASFGYDAPTQEQVLKMKTEDLEKLSPAEKYDIWMGNYAYPTVERERMRTDESMAFWEGICHGWAAAAMNFFEPQSTEMIGAYGVKVPFGSSDIKALLSLYQGEISKAPVHFLAQRCEANLEEYPELRNSPECKGVNAGAFHIVLSNQIGIMKKSFVVDVSRGHEVWNQPVTGFESRIIEDNLLPHETSARGTFKVVKMETTMSFVKELGASWHAFGSQGIEKQKKYYYYLELNRFGNIIGGDWKSDERPDFIWNQDYPKFRGYYKNLEDLYKTSIKN